MSELSKRMRELAKKATPGPWYWREPKHTFQVLTKRAKGMRDWFAYVDAHGFSEDGNASARGTKMIGGSEYAWPLANLWLGVSVENQETADERIPHLLATPAAIRFLSCEPLLGPVDLRWCEWCGRFGNHDCEASPEVGLDWVIVGGESGPGARPCDVTWIRSIVAQCKAAGVPVFVKQLGARPIGEWGPGKLPQMRDHPARRNEWILRDRKGGDPSEWPEDLRVREMPR